MRTKASCINIVRFNCLRNYSKHIHTIMMSQLMPHGCSEADSRIADLVGWHDHHRGLRFLINEFVFVVKV